MSRKSDRDIFVDTDPCKGCGKPTVLVDMFPGSLCLKCYEVKMQSEPLQDPTALFAASVRKL